MSHLGDTTIFCKQGQFFIVPSPGVKVEIVKDGQYILRGVGGGSMAALLYIGGGGGGGQVDGIGAGGCGIFDIDNTGPII